MYYMSKLKLYFVRHGETQYNIEKRMQGFCDSPLTDRGIQQAKAVGAGLASIDFEAVYASESQRVQDTAKFALGEKALLIKTDARLKEMNFGILESLLQEEIISEHGNILEKIFSMSDINFKVPKGESFTDLLTRTKAAVDEIIATHKENGGNILIFSHGVTIGYLIMSLAKMETFPHHDNCCVSVISYENGEITVEMAADPSFRDKGMELLSSAK